MIDYTNKKIIDYKCSASSNCKLDWIIQLLTYVSLLYLEKPDILIETIEIYNPILGTKTSFDIKDWNKHKELLSFLSKTRNNKL